LQRASLLCSPFFFNQSSIKEREEEREREGERRKKEERERGRKSVKERVTKPL
jgi:hypothetical protein